MDLKLKKYFKTQFLKNNGSFIDLPVLDGVEISSSCANLYKKKNGKDLCLYFENGAGMLLFLLSLSFRRVYKME